MFSWGVQDECDVGENVEPRNQGAVADDTANDGQFLGQMTDSDIVPIGFQYMSSATTQQGGRLWRPEPPLPPRGRKR
jgi:hypothetical protein